jgi:hypothetical protein
MLNDGRITFPVTGWYCTASCPPGLRIALVFGHCSRPAAGGDPGVVRLTAVDDL